MCKGRQPRRPRYPHKRCHNRELDCGKFARVATVSSQGLELIAHRGKLCNAMGFMRGHVVGVLCLMARGAGQRDVEYATLEDLRRHCLEEWALQSMVGVDWNASVGDDVLEDDRQRGPQAWAFYGHHRGRSSASAFR